MKNSRKSILIALLVVIALLLVHSILGRNSADMTTDEKIQQAYDDGYGDGFDDGGDDE